MSSLRNAVKRITHKERGQPQNRKHLGILEKKSDYKKRAKHYHKREDLNNAMRTRAAMRNPDEFYFGMNNAQVDLKDGKHKKTRDAKQKEFEELVGVDTIRLMKDQDLNYIRMQKQIDLKKIEKLQSSLHFLEPRDRNSNSKVKQSKHTIFVDSKKEADNFDPVKYFDTVPQFVNRQFNRPRIESLRKSALERLCVSTSDGSESAVALSSITKEHLIETQKKELMELSAIAKERNNSYREMKERKKRVAAMENAEAHLITQRHLQKKGKKRKISSAQNDKPAVYVWEMRRLG